MSSIIKLFQRAGMVASVPPGEQMLINFRNMVNPLDTLLTRSDQELGGFSTVALDLIKSQESQEQESADPPQFGRFHGTLSLDLPPSRPDVVQSGYAMFRTRDRKPTIKNMFESEFWNWENCSHVLLRVRGDRRKYFINVQAETPLVTDIFQHRLFLKTPGQWETVVVPLSDFILTNWGVIQQQEPMDLQHVRTIGIGLIDKQYGPYSLDIDWIKVVSSDRLSKQTVNAQPSHSIPTPGKRLSIDD